MKSLKGLILLIFVFVPQIWGQNKETFEVTHITPDGPITWRYYKELRVQYAVNVPSPFVAKNNVARAMSERVVSGIRFAVDSLPRYMRQDREFNSMLEKRGANRFYTLSVSGSEKQLHELYQALQNDPTIQSVSYSPVVIPFDGGFPNDELFSHQWSLKNTGRWLVGPGLFLPAASKEGKDTSWLQAIEELKSRPLKREPDVYVLDTGRYKHSDFDPAKNFFNYSTVEDSDSDSAVADDYGHSCHVGGTVFAQANNKIGIAGIADFVGYAFIKVMKGGSGSLDDVNEGIYVAIYMAKERQRPSVINMSLGALGYDPAMQAAVDSANEAGIKVVVSAGNNAMDIRRVKFSPASLRGLISVSATTPEGEHAPFSNYGGDLEAPGAAVLSTVPTTGGIKMFDPSGYMFASGTSMAAPHVTGAVALILSRFPDLTLEQVKIRLMNTDNDLPSFLLSNQWRDPLKLSRAGGRLNIRKALEYDFIPPSRPQLGADWVGHSSAGLRIFRAGDDTGAGKMFGFRIYSANRVFDPNNRAELKAEDVKTFEVLPYFGEQDPLTFQGSNLMNYIWNATGEQNQPLKEDAQYFVSFQAIDNVGNVSEPSDVVPIHTAKKTALFQDDFEGQSSFTAVEGPMSEYLRRNYGDNPKLFHPLKLADGNTVQYAGIDGEWNYGTQRYSDWELVVEIDLSSVKGSVSAEFDKFLQMLPTVPWGFERAEVAVLETVRIGELEKTVREVIAELQNNKELPLMNQNPFERVKIDLSKYAGQKIKILIRLFADGSTVGIGLVIDNFTINIDQ